MAINRSAGVRHRRPCGGGSGNAPRRSSGAPNGLSKALCFYRGAWACNLVSRGASQAQGQLEAERQPCPCSAWRRAESCLALARAARVRRAPPTLLASLHAQAASGGGQIRGTLKLAFPLPHASFAFQGLCPAPTKRPAPQGAPCSTQKLGLGCHLPLWRPPSPQMTEQELCVDGRASEALVVTGGPGGRAATTALGLPASARKRAQGAAAASLSPFPPFPATAVPALQPASTASGRCCRPRRSPPDTWA